MRGFVRLCKDLIKGFVRAVLLALPKNALDTVLDELHEILKVGRWRHKSRFKFICKLAREANILSIKVAGDYGAMQSTVDDSQILFLYSEDRRFADRCNNILVEFFKNTGGTYLDVGANIGMTVVPIAQNKDVRILALEPEPANFENLVANVAANCPHRNVQCHQVAAFSRRDHLVFELAADNLGDHRLRLNEEHGRLGEHDRRTIKVDALPIDEFVSDLREPIAIKIDTQGAEPYVLAGATTIIARASLLVSEFWPYGMTRMGGDVDVMLSQLRNSFSSIQIAEQEEGDLGEIVDAASASGRLHALYNLHKDNPDWYCDIVARK